MPSLYQRLIEVDGIDPRTAKTIANEFDSVDDLQDSVTDLPTGHTPPRLVSLNGFGPSRAHRIAQQIDRSGVLEETFDK
ncbi:helix-hairpin-helix domain-containing protein [Halorubrum kocurii]|uniref:Uncharacterized protein n=1 Tax=Halorubrum kocurii JCM 14978 TaxID=1230456 RepID=M0NGC9_9EURY|nr:helix-hairpin-helix domain-containing protein [Halorubrum kocurii]EMA57012.1 hypothetical protein C468_16904 [Halorubrum kocurii JCM 14978]